MAGRFSTRIIIAASTESEVLISIRFIIRDRTTAINCCETITVIIKAAVPSRSVPLPLSSTKPVNALVMLVISMPKTVPISVRPTKVTISPVFRQSVR